VFDRTRYDIRAIGLASCLQPVLACACFLGISLLVALEASPGDGGAQARGDLARGLLFLIEFGLPPVAGLVAANLIDSDPAKELHLSVQRRYAQTMFRRLAIFLIWSALVCAAVQIALQITGYWIAPQPSPLNQLTWFGPLLWFGGLGSLLTLLLGSRIGSAAVLGMVWLGELFFRSFFISNPILQKLYLFLTISSLTGGDAPNAAYWTVNRLTLGILGTAFIGITLLLLRRNEALLRAEA
jgi:hypothetical protein